MMQNTPTSNPATPDQLTNLIQHTSLFPNTPPVSQYAGSDGHEQEKTS
eukprot:CAMPEP_0202706308 /NCGR_PEP_ID=MMETSP1385-20130828/18751_1 /ASSEMBLY_ACC=CAM_ASM_000861 /TAXON_ID=933848 /ORGANISM="Elphidium margaritaceum" /LENGTH=47 /DNA_ID=CAMNT_0049364749 /DNA_START=1 /DNA_END=144 /DNA_ORIENTATION=+